MKFILALLEAADTIEDMDLPGLYLHELKGKRKGTWSLKVNGNWRITFRLGKGDALDVINPAIKKSIAVMPDLIRHPVFA